MIMVVLLAFAAEAKVVTGTPFADNMVLQRGRAVPVWGKAGPGEEVFNKNFNKSVYFLLCEIECFRICNHIYPPPSINQQIIYLT